MEARLTAKRLTELQQRRNIWGNVKSTCSLRELQSLTGKLNFACGVVRRGRTYLRRLITAQRDFKDQCDENNTVSSQRPITNAARADIRWWRTFIADWNGRGLLYELEWIQSTKIELFTDASKKGYGAAYGHHWLRGEWSDEQIQQAKREDELSIPFLELHALVYAAVAWSKH